MNKEKSLSRSRILATKLMYEALSILDKNGSEMAFSDLIQKLGEILDFDAWEQDVYDNGNARWQSALMFYSINLVKGGFLVKNKGRWFLTDKGKEAISKYSPSELFDVVHKCYVVWRKSSGYTKEADAECSISANAAAPFEKMKAQAAEDLMQYIRAKNAYEFQDMVAALLRAMDYYTPFIAPKGRDGGVDIIAYRDPLGVRQPIVKVQVKHYSLDNPVTVDVIRSIIGVAKNDVPVVVTSGRFADAAKTEARQYNVRLIDGYEFSDLWVEYFDKMPEADKSLMPIEPRYIIKRNE